MRARCSSSKSSDSYFQCTRIKFSSMSISFHMRAWKQDFFCLSIYRSAILPVSVLHPFPSSHNILNVCSVHSCTVLSCVWLYQTYYAVFTSILFSAVWFLLFLGSIWLLLVLLLLFLLLNSVFAIHLWIRDCRGCIENLKTISCSPLLLQYRIKQSNH